MINRVALASGRFQALMIDDGDPTVAIVDKSSALEFSRDRGDPGPPSAKHRGQELMGQRHGVRLNAIAGHQQPACAALFDRMKSITRRGLRAEIEKGVDKLVHDGAKGRALFESCLAERGIHPQRASRDLHDDMLGRRPGAQQGGYANKTLRPDHPYFAGRAVGHDCHDRRDPLFNKVDVFDRFSDLV